MLVENKIIEAQNIFDNPFPRDPEFEQKIQSRIRVIHRAQDQLERAAELAKKNGNTSKATELLNRVQELQDLIDVTEEEEAAGTQNGESSSGNSKDDPNQSENKPENTSENSESNEGAPGNKEEKPSSNDTENKSNTGGQAEDNSNEKESGEDAPGPNVERGDTKANSHSGEDESNDQNNLNSDTSDNNSTENSNSESDSKINPFEMNPNAKPGQGGKEPKEPTIKDIINILKKTSGDGRSGVNQALKDILSKRGIDPNLSEALKPLPNKSLSSLSDDEFNDVINNILDEVDSITPLPFVDSADRKARITKINTDMANPMAKREIELEDNINLQRDRAILKARDKEKEKFKNFRTIDQFKINFWRTIKDQVETYEEIEETPTRINRQYDGETDVLKPGKRTEDRFKEDKPSIDFYFDMSGSWTGDKKAIEIGKSAVKTVQEFEDAGEIILNIYYFSNSVVTSMDDPSLGRGTRAWNDIQQHIKQNNSKNVVLMTDSDMDTQASVGATCVVDGCVWLIWKNGDSSQEIAKHLVGRQGTTQYSFN